MIVFCSKAKGHRDYDRLRPLAFHCGAYILCFSVTDDTCKINIFCFVTVKLIKNQNNEKY